MFRGYKELLYILLYTTTLMFAINFPRALSIICKKNDTQNTKKQKREREKKIAIPPP